MELQDKVEHAAPTPEHSKLVEAPLGVLDIFQYPRCLNIYVVSLVSGNPRLFSTTVRESETAVDTRSAHSVAPRYV